MNILDITILVILGVAILLGFLIGVARVLCTIGALVASVFLALQFNGPVSGLFSELIDSESLRRAAAFGLIFLAVLSIGSLAAWAARRFLKIVHLGWLDRIVGALVGGAGALLLSTLIVLAVAALAPEGSDLLSESAMAPLTLRGAEIFVSLVPEDLQQRIGEQRKALNRTIEKKAPELLESVKKKTGATEKEEKPEPKAPDEQ